MLQICLVVIFYEKVETAFMLRDMYGIHEQVLAWIRSYLFYIRFRMSRKY